MTGAAPLPPPLEPPPQPPPAAPRGYVAYEAVIGTTGYELATWVRRAVGLAINWAAAAVCWMPMIVVDERGASAATTVVVVVLAYVTGFVYLLLYASAVSRTGRWIGQRVVGIRIVRVTTLEPPTWWRSAARLLLSSVNTLPCYLGWFWPMWDPMRQTFADMIVDTIVVRDARTSAQVPGVADNSATSASI